MKKRVGVVLSGAGYLDGSELQESILTLLALDQAGAEVSCFAPDVPQLHVINHLTREPMPEQRNVLVESARVARSAIQDVKQAELDRLDALILPGGYGAAKNLCSFAVEGPGCSIVPEVAALLRAALAAGKPVGVMCIAPAVLAAALKEAGPAVQLTIGSDAGTAQAIERMGAQHVNATPAGLVVDEAHKVVSTPAYMYNSSISTVAQGISALVQKVLELA